MRGNLQAVVFDFDGVIIDSIPTKSHAFAHVLRDYPDSSTKALLQYHKENGGVSRRLKFEHFFKHIEPKPLDSIDLNSLEEEFGDYVMSTLKNRKYLIQDCLNFIEKIRHELPLYVASAAFENEVKFLCKHHNISKYFKEIYGYPVKKPDALKAIAGSLRTCTSKLLLVGDSKSDLNAAHDAGTNFWGYNSSSLQGVEGVEYKTSLSDVKLL